MPEQDGARGGECARPSLRRDRLPPLSDLDKKVLAGRNKGRRFDLSIVFAVAARCRYNYPQVLLCKPFDGDEPFPTAFWLTCPYLDKRCSELESGQQIAKLEEVLAARPDEAAKWHKEHACRRESMLDKETADRISSKNAELLRSALGKGAGGIDCEKNPSAAKCLHMQVAAWIGMGWHPASDWLEERFDSTGDCGREYCRRYTE